MLKTQYYLICIFLCVIISTNKICAADNYSNALKIFSEGKFFRASVEFERVIFYEHNNVRVAQCRYYKALCYNGLGDAKRALNELDEINMIRVPDSLFVLIRYEQAFCNFLINEPGKALWNLEEIRAKSSDSTVPEKILPLNVICLNALRKWDESILLLNRFIDNSSLADSAKSNLRQEVEGLYSKRTLPKFHSPTKAENLSRFVPGSGQIYSGEFFEGSFNFLMNATLLGFAFYQFYTECYFTGYVVGLTLFNKTYHGGMHRANLLATQKNLKSMSEFNINVTGLVLKIIELEKTKTAPAS